QFVAALDEPLRVEGAARGGSHRNSLGRVLLPCPARGSVEFEGIEEAVAFLILGRRSDIEGLDQPVITNEDTCAQSSRLVTDLKVSDCLAGLRPLKVAGLAADFCVVPL